MSKLSIRDLDLKGKRIYVQADLNMPLDEQSRVTNDGRIQASLPTIQFAQQHRGKVILASHLGHPKGKVNPRMSLKPIAKTLSKILNRKVPLASDCVRDSVLAQTKEMQD